MKPSKTREENMPIIEHIRELRNTVIISFIAYAAACIVCFLFSSKIISVFTNQFNEIASVIDRNMVISSIAEGFMTQLKMTVIAALIITLPVHIFGIVKFIFPGLTLRERRIVMAFLSFSLILIILGSYLAYFKIVPLTVRFLTNPRFLPQGVGVLLNYQTNVFYILTFMLWAVLALQMPLLMEILLALNILQRKQVLRASRYIVVFIFVISAIITPPDVISQLGIALPLIFFYFLALLIAKIFKFGEG